MSGCTDAQEFENLFANSKPDLKAKRIAAWCAKADESRFGQERYYRGIWRTSMTNVVSDIPNGKTIARRQFLRFLAGSPLLTASSVGAIASLLAASPHQALAQSYDVLRGSRRALGPDGIITAAADA